MSSFSDLALEIRDAAEQSCRWAERGWTMTFGKRERSVATLAAARELEEAFPYRLEAVSYWRRVEQAGAEAADWGRRAAAALERGDLRDADDCLYFAVFIERPLRGACPQWGPLYRKLRERTRGPMGSW